MPIELSSLSTNWSRSSFSFKNLVNLSRDTFAVSCHINIFLSIVATGSRMAYFVTDLGSSSLPARQVGLDRLLRYQKLRYWRISWMLRIKQLWIFQKGNNEMQQTVQFLFHDHRISDICHEHGQRRYEVAISVDDFSTIYTRWLHRIYLKPLFSTPRTCWYRISPFVKKKKNISKLTLTFQIQWSSSLRSCSTFWDILSSHPKSLTIRIIPMASNIKMNQCTNVHKLM